MGSCELTTQEAIKHAQGSNELIYIPQVSPKENQSICFRDEFDCDTDEKTISLADNSYGTEGDIEDSVIDFEGDDWNPKVQISLEPFKSRNIKTMASIRDEIDVSFQKLNHLCLSSNGRCGSYTERNAMKSIIDERYKYVFESERPKYFPQRTIKISGSFDIQMD